MNSSAYALGIPPKPTAWITDNGNLLSSDQVQTLNQKCEDFYQASKAELLVMTFPSLEGEDPLGYTNRVLNNWKTKDGKDRIAIIFIFAKERQLRIQVGYGLEGELTDAFTGDVYRNTLVPAFRSGDYYSGISAAIDRLAKQVDPNWTPPGAATSTSPAGMPHQLPPRSDLPPDRSPSGGEVNIGSILPLLMLLVIIFFVIVPMMRRRSGGCSGCVPIVPLGGCGGGGFGGGGFGGGGWGGTTFGGGGGGGGGGGWSVGGNWGSGGGSSFGGGGSGGGW